MRRQGRRTALFQTLQRIRNQQYADFPTDEGYNDVEDALEEILHALGGPQGADEAYQIFYNSLKLLDSKQAYDMILDILVDAVTGEPIIASSSKKRQLFNWLLVDVIPSAYYLRLPSAFYWSAWPFVPLGSR